MTISIYSLLRLLSTGPVIVLVFCLGVLAVVPGYALIETDQLSSRELSNRYRSLIDEYRCPKCQNQNLAGSDSPISADLRKQIRRMLEDSYSDEQISDYLVARYGNFVLYRPRLNESTYLLWLGPGILLVIAFVVVGRVVLRQRTKIPDAAIVDSSALNDQEQQLHDDLHSVSEQDDDISIEDPRQ